MAIENFQTKGSNRIVTKSTIEVWKLLPKGKKIALFFIMETLLLVIAYWCICIYWYNRDMEEMNLIRAAEQKIQNECKRRDDLMPNLINITRNYANHERELFKYVSEARMLLEPISKMRGASGTSGNSDVEKALSKLIALSEQYPQLKAIKSFQDLMDMVETTEDRVGAMREEFIRAAEDYNLCNQLFTCNFFTWGVAPFMNIPPYVDYFHTDSVSAPQIELSDLSGGEMGLVLSNSNTSLVDTLQKK